MKKRKPLPPTYFVIYLLLAIVLHFAVPQTKLRRGFYNHLGVLLVAVGIWLNLWADRLLKKEKTTVKPFEQSRA
jgi:protein-S-isoprenylcysteine O-methyltransferase Ste14